MTYRTLAWAKFHQQHFEEAHTFAKESLKYEPTSAEGLYLLGASEIALKRVDVGLAEVGGFIHSNPQWAPGYVTLGTLQAMAGQFDDADVSLRKALELDTNLMTAQLSLADVQLAEGKLDQAMEGLSKLAQQHSNFAPAQVQMGQISEIKQDWTSAASYYSKALAISPDDVVAKNNLAWVYAEHGGNIDVALKLAQEAKEMAPDNPDVSDTLGWILLKKQHYATAAQLLGDCVRRRPEKASFRYHLGVAYYYLGQKPQAEQALQAALRLDPNFSNAEDAKKILVTLND
jgi:tetratricopeptide (TPR) repeat protein